MLHHHVSVQKNNKWQLGDALDVFLSQYGGRQRNNNQSWKGPVFELTGIGPTN